MPSVEYAMRCNGMKCQELLTGAATNRWRHPEQIEDDAAHIEQLALVHKELLAQVHKLCYHTCHSGSLNLLP